MPSSPSTARSTASDLRRRQKPPEPLTTIPLSHHPTQIPSLPALFLLPTTLTLLFLLVSIFYHAPSHIPSHTPPDLEQALSLYLPLESYRPSNFSERVLVCMPTVSRPAKVEYVSNAIKSFRLATNGSEHIFRLVVFDMDAPKKKDWPEWLAKVFVHQALPDWLQVLKRLNDTVPPPRKFTLGDDEKRVKWRSKEVCDYAEVIERCATLTDAEYLLVVQDDVLFTNRIKEIVEFSDRFFEDKVEERGGRKRVLRTCSISLFDLPGRFTGVDAHVMQSSNMVARVWKRDKVDWLVRYLKANYDEAPVDWLADRLCGKSRRTLVMEPNGVRHRGKVGSFEGNKRDNLLT